MNWNAILDVIAPETWTCRSCLTAVPTEPVLECASCGHGWTTGYAVGMHDYVTRSALDVRLRGTPVRPISEIDQCPCCAEPWSPGTGSVM